MERVTDYCKVFRKSEDTYLFDTGIKPVEPNFHTTATVLTCFVSIKPIQINVCINNSLTCSLTTGVVSLTEALTKENTSYIENRRNHISNVPYY